MALQPPSPETQKKLKEALYQDPEVTARDVQHIKDWLSKQPHLPQIDDDVFLERFLHGCKYRLSRCKEVLDMYFTVRGAAPQLFGNRDPLSPDMKDACKCVFVSPVPKLTPDGHRMTFLGLLDNDPTHYNFVAQAKRCLMLIDTHLKLEAWLGEIYVFDLKGVSLTHIAKMSPVAVRSLLLCLQNAFPIRIKGFHFVNAPSYVDKILQLIKPFMKEKIVKRIHVHPSLDSLYEAFPKEMLPRDYGGQSASLAETNDWWQNEMIDMREWFLSEGNKTADEQKRVGKIANSEQLFGLDGSFKTLSID